MTKTGSGETRIMAEYAAAYSYNKLPLEVVEKTKMLILDTIGVTIAASKYAPGKIITKFARSLGGGPEATILCCNQKVDAINAALANGTMAHDMELDDVHLASNLHTSAVLVPASLAIAERNHCSGQELITSVSLGYDIGCRISIALDNSLQYARSFHPSSVCGTFGAAAAAAKCLHLDSNGFINTLGLAGSQASGLNAWATEPDHFTKSFQTGVPARNGITAALLASMGYQSVPAIFDGRFNVFDAFSGKYHFVKLVEGLGTRFEIMRTSIKKYACCRYIHAPLDAFFSILKEYQIKPQDISAVVIRLPETGAPIVDNNELYTHNTQYILAVAAFDGKLYREQYSPERRKDPKVLDLASKMRVIGDSELEKVYPDLWAAIVEVTTNSGNTYRRRVDYAKGAPENPLTKEEIQSKFNDMTQNIIGKDRVRKVSDLIWSLEEVHDVCQVSELLEE